MAASKCLWLFLLVVFALMADWCECDKLSHILRRHQPYCGISYVREESNDTSLTGRIVGGNDADRFEFPWQISLRRWSFRSNRWYHSCGGAIIDNEWILTAAHCTMGKNISVDDFKIRIGEHNYSHPEGYERDLNVSKIIAHKDFSMITIEPDINLIKLAEPISLGPDSKFTPVCVDQYSLLANLSDLSAKTCVSSGWGKLKYHGKFPSILQKVAVSLVDPDQCQKAYEGIADVTDGMICSGRGGKGTCEGDSGGPLQCLDDLDKGMSRQRWSLYGLTSFAVGCAEERYPSVAARVARYREWIAHNMEAN